VRMAHEGQEVVGPDGGWVRFLRITEDLLEMEALFGGVVPLPPPHVHPRQDEHFEVLDGAVRAVIGDHHHRYAAGDTFEVPAGTVHTMGGDGPARVNWQVRPALRSADFTEAMYEGAVAADPELFLARYADEVRLVAPVDERQRSS
jgi:mannose-6-phosphate isomerase-like protein (cupin superfamily)